MNRDDIGGVIVERGQPLFLLRRWPFGLRWRHIIISFGGALLECARRVHRCERGRAAVLRRFFDARPHFGRNRDQFAGNDKLPDRLEIFIDVSKQTLRRWVLVLHLFENLLRRFVRIDFSGGIDKCFLFFAQLTQAELENFLRRKIDKFRFLQETREFFFANCEIGGGFR